MKKLLCMILAFLLVTCSMSVVITSYADDSVNLLADATFANGDVSWTDKIDPRNNLKDSKTESVYGGYSWTFGLGYAEVAGSNYEYVSIKTYGLTVGTQYEFSYIYQRDFIFEIESITTGNGAVADYTAPTTSNVAEKARSYKVSTTLTVPVNGDYVIKLKINRDMRTADCGWDSVCLSDLSLTPQVAAANLLENATYANGDVSWTTETDVANRVGNIDSWGQNDNTSKSVNGGYSWSFGLGDGRVGGDGTYNTAEYKETYAYIYIKAKGLVADTRYDFSYIYQKDFAIALDKITDKDGSVVELENSAIDVAIDGGDRARQVSTTFKAPVTGDYTITLKTNRTMSTPSSEWSHTVLSDLFLMNSAAAAKVKAEVVISGNGDATVSEDLVLKGTEVTFTATPWEGEDFLGWYKGDDKVSDDLAYTVTITEKTTLTAKFTSNNLNVLAGKKASDWTGYQHAKIEDSTESKNGGKGYLVKDAMYQSMYTKVTLKPNTEYKFSFNWKGVANANGAAYPKSIKVYPVNAVDIENRSNWQDGNFNPANVTDLEQGENYANADMANAGTWQSVNTGFTTTNETEYNLLIYFQIDGTPNHQSINLSDLVLEEVAGSGGGEDPAPQLTDITKLKASDWTGYQWSKVEDSTESKDGGNAYLVKDAMYQNIYTSLTLKPDTEYKLSFNWKSVQNDKGAAFPNEVVVVSKKDIDIDDRNNWQDSDFKYGSFDLEKGGAMHRKDDAETLQWQNTTVSFTTKGDSDYSLLIHFQTDGNGGQQIYVSDFKLEEVGGESSETPTHTELSEKTASEWRGVRWSQISDSTDSKDGGKAYLVEKAMNQNINTTINLKANTRYKVSFNWKSTPNNKGLAFVQSASLYSSKSGDPNLPATNESDPNWGASCNYKYESWGDYTPIYIPNVGYTNLVEKSTVTNPNGNADADDALLTAWNSYSANFSTTKDTEYYFFVNFGLKGSNGNQSAVVSDFVLEELGPAEGGGEEENGENLAVNYTTANGHVTYTDNAGTHFVDNISDLEGGYSWGFGMPESNYETNPVYVTIKTDELKAGNKYEFSFTYQKDFIIVFDSIDNGAEIFKEPEDVKLLEGDRAHRVTLRFTATKDGVHNIKLKMGKGNNNENCQWSHVVLCDLKLYDITDRVYGTVKSELGGTATGFDKAYCQKGETITLIATPRSGNTFVGWFDENNNLVSEDATFVFTAAENFNYLAVFSGNNIPNGEWLSQHGMDGTFEDGTMNGWKAEDREHGDDTSWQSFERSDFISYNGKYSLKFNSRYRTTFYRFNDLKANTNYFLSFYVNLPDALTYDDPELEEKDKNAKAMVKWFSVTADGVELFADNNTCAIPGGSGWYKINIYFNTGSHTTADWNFYFTNKDGQPSSTVLKQFVYMDDIKLIEYTSDTFKNGDFATGADSWRGEFTVDNGAGKVAEDNYFYQNVKLGEQTRHTVKFKAKGKGVGGFSELTDKVPDASNYISSQTAVNIDSADWKEYSFEVYSGVNPDASLFFKSTEGELLIDDITVTDIADRGGAVVEKVDFESERFALREASDVFEIYNGTEGDANVHSGTKSLRFNSAKAEEGVEYLFNEAFLSAQVTTKLNYRLTLYYKTAKGNSLYIAPEYLKHIIDGDVQTTYTAADNGWTKVDFMFNKLTKAYVKTLIGNILNKTKGDFYIDDITLNIAPPMVLETNSKIKYCEWPLNIMNNQGFEDEITDNDWANLPGTTEIIDENGNKYLRIKAGTHYVLPVIADPSDNYYFSVSSRLGKNSSGYIAITTDPEGKILYNDINGTPSSKIAVDSAKWNRDSFLFSTNELGIVYVVFSADKGYIDIDETHLYKKKYGWTTDPNDHTKFVPYDYDNPDPSTIVLDGGDPTFGEGEEDDSEFESEDNQDNSTNNSTDNSINNSTNNFTDNSYDDSYDDYYDDQESPSTGDNVALPIALILIAALSVAVLVITKERFPKKSKGGKA